MNIDSLSFVYAYGCRNAGDFAINQGSVTLLERTLPDTTVTAISRFDEESEEYSEIEEKMDSFEKEIQLFGGPITYDPKSQSRSEQFLSLTKSGLQYLYDIAGFSEESRFYSRMYDQITGSDAMIYNGGNAIHYSPSHQSFTYLLAVLYPLHVARRNDVPYALLPQTIFGLEGIAKELVVPILNDAEFVMTRDMETFRYLSQFGLSTQLINAVDTAFLNGDPSPATASSEQREIAVVPRFSTLGDTGERAKKDSEMEETFFEYLRTLVARGHRVTLTLQTEIDKEWAEANRERLKSIGVEFFVNFDPAALREHYDDVDLLVTMRLHAAIFALSVGTPTISAYKPGWGPKIRGTFETLDISEYVLTWDEATLEALTSVTDDALRNLETLSEEITSSVTTRNRQMSSDFRSALRVADGFSSERP
ncbi:polysaccharide pyruvyl transferase family protein [Halosimplex sp. J119]